MKKFVAMMAMVIMVLSMMGVSYAEYDTYFAERDLKLYEYLMHENPDNQEVFARFAVGYNISGDYYVEDFVIFGKDGVATNAGWSLQMANGEVRYEDYGESIWEGFTENSIENSTFEIVKDDEYQTLCNVDRFIEERKNELEIVWVKYY